MPPALPPTAVAVEVHAAQPTPADSAAIAHLSARDRTALPEVTYLVRLRFDKMPEPTSHGWALYVGEFRIPKYWETKDGIYFKIPDRRFFDEHAGQALRFSSNGTEFVDTGLKLPRPESHHGSRLPRQEDVLR